MPELDAAETREKEVKAWAAFTKFDVKDTTAEVRVAFSTESIVLNVSLEKTKDGWKVVDVSDEEE